MPSHAASAPILTAGVDWLTCTVRAGESPQLVRRFGRWLLDLEQDAGGKLRAIRLHGYAGHQANHVFYGERPDGALLQLSGREAAEWWSWPTALGAHVTRCDWQVTVQLPEDRPLLAWDHWRECVAAEGQNHRPVALQVIRTNRRGDTFYLGKRSSERFGRCYDKHREQPEQYPPGAWRYEVELHGPPAQLAVATLVQRVPYLPALAATVHDHFSTYGARPTFAPAAVPCDLRLPYSRSDDAKALEWLRDQVRPTVTGLVDRGRLDDVLAALGLDLGGPVSRAYR